MQPGSTNTMSVTVAVPAAAALGSYKVTLTASNGSPATTRSNTGTLTVTDRESPSIRISTPRNGSTFTFGQAVAADYGCTDQTNASGVKSCSGPVANGARVDTGSLGSKLFTVNASDNAGNTTAATSTYTVKPRSRAPDHDAVQLHPLHAQDGAGPAPGQGNPKGSTLTVKCKGKRCPVRKRFRKVKPRRRAHPQALLPEVLPAGHHNRGARDQDRLGHRDPA